MEQMLSDRIKELGCTKEQSARWYDRASTTWKRIDTIGSTDGAHC